MRQSLEILKVFITIHLKLVFWKMKALFRKLEYSFSVESTTIKSAIFPYKTALPKANVKTNKIESTEWTYHKERSFVTNCLIYKWLIQSINYQNVHIHIFLKSLRFSLGCVFPVSILNDTWSYF